MGDGVTTSEMGTIINRMEMVVLPNSSMWYHILIYGMDTQSNRNDNVTLEVMDGKKQHVLPKGCRKVRVGILTM